MNRGILALLLLLLPFGCANNVTGLKPEPVMLFTFAVKGEIANSPDLNYYFVINASNNQSQGPTMNGPYPLNAPNPGWNLPFYRDYDVDPGSAETLRETVWTDYYQLSSEAGTFVMSHGWWPNPFEKSRVPTILPGIATLQRGKDWDMSGGTVTLTIPFSSLKGFQDLTKGPQDQPPPLFNPTTGVVSQSYLNVNLAVSGRDGAVIDFPTVTPNEYVTIPTRLGITESPIIFPIKNTANIPAGVSPDSVQLTRYRVEIKNSF